MRSFADSTHRHLVELVSGGYARIDGRPIQDESEIRAVIPEPHLSKALTWWEHRDETPLDEEPERPVMFKRGAPCYVDTGDALGSLNEILDALPEKSPFREAALVWWEEHAAQAQQAAFQAQQSLREGTGLIPVPQELPPPKPGRIRNPVVEQVERRVQRKPGYRVEELYNEVDEPVGVEE